MDGLTTLFPMRWVREWTAGAEGRCWLTEQVLDVKGSLRLIRRSWRLVAVFVLLGIGAGAGYEVLFPAGYQATSLVLLPLGNSASATSGSSASNVNNVATDGRIATSAAVLIPAGHQADPSLSLSTLERRVKTFASAAGVLGITATGPTARQAMNLANAVAQQLITFVSSNGLAANSDALTALQAQEDQINQQITDAQKELSTVNQELVADGPTSPAGQQDSDLVGKLTAEESNLGLELDTVESQISQTKLGPISANEGTEVIQKAIDASGLSTSSLVLLLAIFAVGGLLVGSTVVLVRHRRDPRLWTRDELADALGSPVVLSLDAPNRRSTNDWVTLFDTYEPSASEQWNIRRALGELGVGDGGVSNLVVVAFGGDTASVALTAQVAMVAAASGLEIGFVVVAEDDLMAGLKAACARLSAGGGPRPRLEVRSGPPSQWSMALDLTLSVVVLDRDHPALTVTRRSGTSTVLSVSAGFASAEQLAQVAIAAADAGESLRGIWVSNPASEDHTVGRFPDANSHAAPVLHRRTLGGVKPGVGAGRAG